MFGSDAVKAVDESTLDQSRLKRYNQHPEMIELLDDWILSPDADLLEKLRPYVKKFESIARLRVGTKLYRGFDATSSYQDTMGLSKKKFLFNEVLKHDVGDSFNYVISKPLSFSTDIDIARAFGKTVVELTSLPGEYIWITDELSTLISRRRNIGPETQKEVILLPPEELTFKILSK